MTFDVPFTCPACGHPNRSPFDPVEGLQEWTTDCENCCRPVALKVRVKRGEVVEIRYGGESE